MEISEYSKAKYCNHSSNTFTLISRSLNGFSVHNTSTLMVFNVQSRSLDSPHCNLDNVWYLWHTSSCWPNCQGSQINPPTHKLLEMVSFERAMFSCHTSSLSYSSRHQSIASALNPFKVALNNKWLKTFEVALLKPHLSLTSCTLIVFLPSRIERMNW